MWLDFKDTSGMDWVINTDHVLAIRLDKTALHLLLPFVLSSTSGHILPIRSFATEEEAAMMLGRIRDALHEGVRVFTVGD